MARIARGLAVIGLAVIGLAVVAAGCGIAPELGRAGPQGPTVVSGVVVGAAGVPLANAEVTLSAADWASALAPGDEVRVVWIDTTLTGPDGRFTFAGRPSPEIVAFAAGQGVVNFDIRAVHPATRSVATWAFPRELDATQWLDEAPDIQLKVVRAG